MLAIEDCLIGKVSGLFLSSKILEMSPEEISRLASETPECSTERKRLEEKRDILDTGLQGLKRIQKPGRFVHPAQWNPLAPEGMRNNLDETPLNSKKPSVAGSVGELSSVTHSQDKPKSWSDVDFELRAASPTEHLEMRGSHTPRGEGWLFTDRWTKKS